MRKLLLFAAIDVHPPDFQPAAAIGLKYEVPAVRRPGWTFIRAPRRKLKQMTSCNVRDKHLKATRAAPGECDVTPVGRPRRRIRMTAPGDQRPLIRPARIHYVNLWLPAPV